MQYIDALCCFFRTDDWEILKEDAVTEVMHWVGDFETCKWFHGYLTFAMMKPCSAWATLKMIAGVIRFNASAVGMQYYSRKMI